MVPKTKENCNNKAPRKSQTNINDPKMVDALARLRARLGPGSVSYATAAPTGVLKGEDGAMENTGTRWRSVTRPGRWKRVRFDGVDADAIRTGTSWPKDADR